MTKNEVYKLFSSLKFGDNAWGLIDSVWEDKYENMNTKYFCPIIQNNLNNVKNISSRWFKALFEQLFTEHMAKNDFCISCGEPVYKFPGGDPYYCVDCKKKRVAPELAHETKKKYRKIKKRDSLFIRTINSIRSKAGLPFLEFPNDEDYKEMKQYSKPVEPVGDDDLPF